MSSDKSQFLASLGNITKSHSALDFEGLRRIADYALQDQSGKLLPKERVNFCLKRRIDKNKDVQICFNENTEKAYYGNVIRCGSVWTCPVCAKKITEKRRHELALAAKRWKENHNGYMYLLTLTNSHNASHALKVLRAGQKKAMTLFWGGRAGQAMSALLGKQYQITNYEVTYGQNGWHPHHHILIFSNKYLSIKDFSVVRDILARAWINACKLAGLPLPSMQHGLDLQDGTQAAKYVGKWGLEYEMTKGHVKKGRAGGLTPFDLLRDSENNLNSAKLFQEFALAFKGARQLMWGRGLKQLLLIEDKTDQELADETAKESIVLDQISVIVFDLICKYKMRADYLNAVRSDYLSGCYGVGQARDIVNYVLATEIASLEYS